MSKELMLTTDVDGLGIVGDVVNVANGYARNYLLPNGLATGVSEAAHRRVAAARAAREIELAQEFEVAEKLKGRLESVSLSIPMKVSDEGTLYGSVGAADIAEAAKAQGIGLKKEQIKLADPIKAIGEFAIPVKLHKDLACELKVWVVQEEGD